MKLLERRGAASDYRALREALAKARDAAKAATRRLDVAATDLHEAQRRVPERPAAADDVGLAHVRDLVARQHLTAEHRKAITAVEEWERAVADAEAAQAKVEAARGELKQVRDLVLEASSAVDAAGENLVRQHIQGVLAATPKSAFWAPGGAVATDDHTALAAAALVVALDKDPTLRELVLNPAFVLRHAMALVSRVELGTELDLKGQLSEPQTTRRRR